MIFYFLHVNKHWFLFDTHVPPDKQGFGEQKLIVVEHCVPVYPHGHEQINELALKKYYLWRTSSII